MKKENGMGYIALIIWIIIIIVAVVVAALFLKKDIENTKAENIITDMLLVQGKVRVIGQENEMNAEEHELKGKKVADNLEDEKIKALLDEGIIKQDEENFDKYYIIDSEVINELDLDDNLNGEYYIANYSNYEIIYTKPIEIDKHIHYTLTELLEHRKKKENNEENVLNEVVNEEVSEESSVEE